MINRLLVSFLILLLLPIDDYYGRKISKKLSIFVSDPSVNYLPGVVSIPAEIMASSKQGIISQI